MTQTIDITVLVKPNDPRTGRSTCIQCDRLKAGLDKLGAEYTTHLIGTPEAQDEFDAAVAEGIGSAPIVIVKGEKDTIRFGGNNTDKVKAHIAPFLHKEI